MRKYENYKLMITYLNGDTEEIEYKGINTSNYKDMLSLYREVREQYKNESVTIDFVGISENGEMKVFFTKKIEVTGSTPDNNPNYEDIMKEISRISDMVIKKKNDLKSLLGIQDKKENIFLHNIENLRNLNDIEKINKFNELCEIRLKRRSIKNEISIYDSIRDRFSLQDTKLNKIFASLDKKVANSNNYDITKDKKQMINEFPYKTFKEKIKLTKELSRKYDKVICDNEKMVIVCYNNCYKCG